MLGAGQRFSPGLHQAYPVAAALFQAEAQQLAKGWLWGCHQDIFRHVKSLSLPMMQGKRRNISGGLQFGERSQLLYNQAKQRYHHFHLGHSAVPPEERIVMVGPPQVGIVLGEKDEIADPFFQARMGLARAKQAGRQGVLGGHQFKFTRPGGGDIIFQALLGARPDIQVCQAAFTAGIKRQAVIKIGMVAQF